MDFRSSFLGPLSTLETAQFFWAVSYKSIDLREKNSRIVINRNWEFQLTLCRKKAIEDFNTNTGNRELPTIVKTSVIENIFSQHQAYRQLFLWKETYDPSNKIDLLQGGELYAPKYFTVEGEFDDFSWTKRFVCDSNYNIMDRFSLSCNYWLEKESEELWLELQRLHGAHIADDLNFLSYFNDNLAMISFRVLQIQYQLTTQGDSIPQRSFWKLGFQIALENGFEHAIYYFWEKMTDREKTLLFRRKTIFKLMDKSLDYPKDKIIYFLFSKMTVDQKRDLIHWTIRRFCAEIWLTLLVSPCSKAIHSEILKICDEFPPEMFSSLFRVLSDRIYTLQLPYDKEIFPVLWNSLLPQEKFYIIEDGAVFMEILAVAKSFENLSYVIKSLSREQKVKCLLQDDCHLGITILNILCDLEEFDMFQKYLSFFLTEMNLSTQKEVMNRTASSILQNFLESADFLKWQESEIFKENEDEIGDRIETLQTSLTLLEEICQKVHNEVRVFRTSSTFYVSEISIEVYERHSITFFSSSGS